jgi:hypothetical protein
MVMSRDQNAGKNGYIQIGNESFKTVEQFKYLGTTLTNQNSTHEEIKSRLKSGNACYSVQNLLSSSLLSKNVKIKIYRNIILSVVLNGCKTWSLTMREWRRLHNKELHALCFSTNSIRVTEMGWARNMYGGEEGCMQDFSGET